MVLITIEQKYNHPYFLLGLTYYLHINDLAVSILSYQKKNTKLHKISERKQKRGKNKEEEKEKIDPSILQIYIKGDYTHTQLRQVLHCKSMQFNLF